MSVIFSRRLTKLEFSQEIFEKYSTSIFMKIRPLEAELFHADGYKDGYYVAHSRFSQFWERI
jgi:hypothetical protein